MEGHVAIEDETRQSNERMDLFGHHVISTVTRPWSPEMALHLEDHLMGKT